MSISKKLTLLAAVALCSTVVSAQIEVKAGDETIKITPSGRVYMDGAFYLDDETKMGNGTNIPDVRIGLKAVYQKWDFKLDMGYANSKVSPKDIHIRYNIDKTSFIKAGYYGELFGYEAWESTAYVKFNGKSPSTGAFESGRRIGVVYERWGKQYWMAAGVYGDGDAVNNTKEGNDGYAATGRFLYTPFKEPGKIFHIGASGTFRKADANGYDEDGKESARTISYAASLGSTAIEKGKPVNATISDADYQAKYNVELLGSYGPLFLVAEYYHTNVERKNSMPAFKGSGAYAQVGFLAIGDNYSYNDIDARLKAPKPKSLELVARYDYLDLNDGHAQIYGGTMSTWAFAVNYYINKHVIAKVNYSHMSMGKKNPFAAGEDVSAIQGRFMIVF